MTKKDAAAVRRLIEQDPAAVDATARNGATPLHIASGLDLPEIAAILISAGADVNAVTDRGGAPLHWAAVRDASKTAALLIEKGAQLHARTMNGLTPLQLALRKNSRAVVSVLLTRISKRRTEVLNDPRFREAYEALDKKDYESALAIFRLLLRDYPESTDVNGGYGIAAFALKEYPHASSAYERILMTDPTNDRARFELGLSYFMQKRFDIAEQELAAVLSRTTDVRVRKAALSYIQDIKKSKSAWRANGMLSLGIVYDNNVNVGPDSDTITIAPISLGQFVIDELEVAAGSKPTESWGVVVSAGVDGSYDVGERGGWLVTAMGTYYQNFLDDASDYEMVHLGGSVGARRTGQRSTIEIPMKARKIIRGGEGLVNLVGTAPSCVYVFGRSDRWQLVGVVTGEYRDYDVLDERDGYFVRAGAGLSRILLGGKHRLTLTASVLHEDTNNDVYSNEGYELNGAWDFSLPWGSSGYLRIRHRELDYRAAEPLETEPRADSQQQYAVGLIKRISPALSFELSGQYVDNNSTFGLYEYSRSMGMMSASWRF